MHIGLSVENVFDKVDMVKKCLRLSLMLETGMHVDCISVFVQCMWVCMKTSHLEKAGKWQ